MEGKDQRSARLGSWIANKFVGFSFSNVIIRSGKLLSRHNL